MTAVPSPMIAPSILAADFSRLAEEAAAVDGAEWLQVRDRNGRPLDRVVALPVKDPFHIARALLLVLETQNGAR